MSIIFIKQTDWGNLDFICYFKFCFFFYYLNWNLIRLWLNRKDLLWDNEPLNILSSAHLLTTLKCKEISKEFELKWTSQRNNIKNELFFMTNRTWSRAYIIYGYRILECSIEARYYYKLVAREFEMTWVNSSHTYTILNSITQTECK